MASYTNMKYITIILIILVIGYFLFPKPNVVSGQDEEKIEVTNVKVIREYEEKPELRKYDNLILKYSEEYDVSFALMSAIMDAENKNRIPDLQSSLKYNFTKTSLGIYYGEREYSFGLVQINLHYNPHITMEQATDPEYSIKFLAKELSLGHHSKWGAYTSGEYLTYMK